MTRLDGLPINDFSKRARRTRRQALGILFSGFSGAAVALLAACVPAPVQPTPVAPPAPTPAAAPKPAGATPAVAANQPKSGGLLRVGMIGDLLNLEGHQI